MLPQEEISTEIDKEILFVLSLHYEELPLHINHESAYVRYLVQELLKKGIPHKKLRKNIHPYKEKT
jgi:hypothetical protein